MSTDNLAGLVTNLTSSSINKFDRKISGKGAVRAEKRFSLFISKEDTDDIIKITNQLKIQEYLVELLEQ